MNAVEIVKTEFKNFLELFNKAIFEVNDAKITLGTIFISIAIIFISIKLASFTAKIVNRTLASREVEPGVRDSLTKFLRYILIIVGVLFALDNLGISIKSLAAFGAVLMVGIGFGLQDVAKNFISGIILLIERPVKVGDVIDVGDYTGRVIDIRVRSTLLKTRDEVTVIIPNAMLISEEVVNQSYSAQITRQHIRLGVAYGSDLKLVEKVLISCAMEHDKVLKDPPPIAVFEDFGDSSLKFDLRFWVSDIWSMERIASDIRYAIDKKFRESEISVPFPQMVVHTSAPQTEN
jgi:small-conductance mechanosensitive channel